MKTKLIALLLVTFTIMLAVFPADCMAGARQAAQLCLNTVLPSLFPFFILSRLFIDSGIVEALAARFGRGMQVVFNLPPASVFAFLMGMISGYPVGAKCAVMLYEQRMCDEQEAERIVALCNNSGPLFIIGAVGAGIFGSRDAGMILYATHIVSAILTGVLYRLVYFRDPPRAVSTPRVRRIPVPLGESMPAAVKSSVELIAYVCGFIIFFGAFVAILEKTGIPYLITLLLGIANIPPDMAAVVVGGMFEITGGINAAAGLGHSVAARLTLSAAILAWSGFSVILQVQGVTYKSRLSLKFFIVSKLTQCVFAAVLTSLACALCGIA